VHKIIINLGVAAYEQSHVVGERFSADNSFMNPRVIPTCIAFWPGEKELNLHIKHTTLEPYCNQSFLNLGCVSHE